MRLKIIIALVLLYNIPLGAMELVVPYNSKATVQPFDFTALPPDVQRIIQMMALKNIPSKSLRRTRKNLDYYARINKSFNAFINTPSHFKLLITLMAWRLSDKNEFDLGRGFRNMRGMQIKEVQEWLKSRKIYPLPFSVFC